MGRLLGLKPLLIVFLVALLVRGLNALALSVPRSWDAMYYYLLAENLARGRGLVEDIIVHYQDHPQGPPPHPAGAIWLPGQAYAEAAAMKLFGVSYRGAQVAAVVLSALMAVLAYQFTREISGRRYIPILAAVLSLACGLFADCLVDTDCHTLYGLAGAMALYSMVKWSGGRMVNTSNRPSDQGRTDHQTKRPGTIRPIWLALSGLWIGVAHITRQDGLLLWAVLLCTLLFWRHFGTKRQGDKSPCPLVSLSPSLLVSLSLYLAVVAPMYARNLRVWGRLSPVDPLYPAFLTRYWDFFAADPRTDVSAYLAKGLGWMVSTKLSALRFNLFIVFAQVAFQVWECPFLALGAWRVRKRRELFPILAYPVLLWLVLGVVYPFPSVHGTFLHSITAFLPFGYGLVAMGVEEAGWLLGKMRGIRAEAMARWLCLLAAAAAIIFTTVAVYRDHRQNLRAQAACWWFGEVFSDTPEETLVMAANPPLIAYCARRPGIVIPDDEAEAVVETMKRFGAEYLTFWGVELSGLERGNPAPLELLCEVKQWNLKIYRLAEGG